MGDHVFTDFGWYLRNMNDTEAMASLTEFYLSSTTHSLYVPYFYSNQSEYIKEQYVAFVHAMVNNHPFSGRKVRGSEINRLNLTTEELELTSGT